MSAKIYSLPKDLLNKIPDIWTNNKDYQKREDAFIKEVSDMCQKRNPVGDKKYIGKTIKFSVADGHAVYMIASLKPLGLIHLPLMDGYEASDVDLMTAKRVKEKVDADKSLQDYFEAQSQATVGECDKAVAMVGKKVSDMTMTEYKSLYDDNETWKNKYQLISYNGVKYLIPNYCMNTGYEHRVYKYLCNNFKVK